MAFAGSVVAAAEGLLEGGLGEDADAASWVGNGLVVHAATNTVTTMDGRAPHFPVTRGLYHAARNAHKIQTSRSVSLRQAL